VTRRAARAPGWLAGDAAADTASIRLFCFAHVGGGPAFFRPWRSALAPEIDVQRILLPGRESRNREEPCRRLEQFLDPLCAALVPLLDRPYALFGHSLGSIVAFEVARRLSEGQRPLCLVVSGRRAPRVAPGRRKFTTMGDDEFFAALGGLGGTPAVVLDQPELRRILLPTLRADFELNESYRPAPGPVLRCPLIAYMGEADPEVDRHELAAWHQETTRDFTMRVFPGGHFYPQDGLANVLDALSRDLARAASQIAVL
jgi:medium-chain acyl-[acyl-carrier-protein] hydrolase